MRIAFIAPLKRPITPETTVSRNRVITELAQGLIKDGHQVSIFGTSDSRLPGATIIPVIPKGLNFLPPTENEFYTHTAYIAHATAEVLRQQQDFDLIHNHMFPEFIPLLALRWFTTPFVTTVHAQITPELRMALSDVRGLQKTVYVCISESARKRLALSAELVYNGIDATFYTPNEQKSGDYLLFVGRMGKAKDTKGKFLDAKGVTDAIATAEKLGQTLKIAGNIEDNKFYEIFVKPHLSGTINLVSEIAPEQKMSREQIRTLYQDAKAFLFPIRWEEPFGLVMIEAMACGTPVIAYNRGSVSEIVRDGITGFIIDPDDAPRPKKGSWVIKKQGIEGLVEAIKRIGEIDRKITRKHVEENFTIEKMVAGYEEVYKKVIEKK
ncbi:glycosyltransferase family 4 protein [Candidatus Giovannonibacteria bacterium]|nr:glycosyltransferase family 4 protein [Candidatus Giovannonibacteria bacterium]